MSDYVVLSPRKVIVTGKAWPSRRDAVSAASQHMQLPWCELYALGYRVRVLVPRIMRTPRLVPMSIDLPEDVLQRLEMVSARTGQSVRHLTSLMVANGLHNSHRITEGGA